MLAKGPKSFHTCKWRQNSTFYRLFSWLVTTDIRFMNGRKWLWLSTQRFTLHNAIQNTGDWLPRLGTLSNGKIPHGIHSICDRSFTERCKGTDGKTGLYKIICRGAHYISHCQRGVYWRVSWRRTEGTDTKSDKSRLVTTISVLAWPHKQKLGCKWCAIVIQVTYCRQNIVPEALSQTASTVMDEHEIWIFLLAQSQRAP